jgi:hypothetical protein
MNFAEFIDILRPDHDRVSCSDEDLANGWESAGYAADSLSDTYSVRGRCGRCMLLELERAARRDGMPLPEAAEVKTVIQSWF